MLDKRIYYKEKKTILDCICFAFSMKYREKFSLINKIQKLWLRWGWQREENNVEKPKAPKEN